MSDDTTTHDLKIWPEHFAAVVSGHKRFEVRVNDRDYRVGDMLHLCEWLPDEERYTGAECWETVSIVVAVPFTDNLVGLGFEALHTTHNTQGSGNSDEVEAFTSAAITCNSHELCGETCPLFDERGGCFNDMLLTSPDKIAAIVTTLEAQVAALTAALDMACEAVAVHNKSMNKRPGGQLPVYIEDADTIKAYYLDRSGREGDAE